MLAPLTARCFRLWISLTTECMSANQTRCVVRIQIYGYRQAPIRLTEIARRWHTVFGANNG